MIAPGLTATFAPPRLNVCWPEAARDVEPLASVHEERARGVREVARAFGVVDHERLEAAVDPLELREARHEPRLGGRRPGADAVVVVLHGAVARHPGEARRARRHPLDTLRAETDLFDVDAWREIFGHGSLLLE